MFSSNQLYRGLRVVVLALLALPSVAAALTIDLTPAFEFPTSYKGRPVIAVGRDGLFLDTDRHAPARFQGNPSAQQAFAKYASPVNNFTWLNVTMEINDHTGDATISGTMSNNAVHNDLYSLSMSLSGMCVRNGNSCQAKSAQPNLDLRAFLEDPANARNDSLGTALNTGFEWSYVGLEVAALPGGPVSAYNGLTNYTGWAMGHDNPVELHVWSNSPGPGNLYLGAWYQAFNHAGQRIGVGDTKAFGRLLDAAPVTTPPPGTEVPEPGTLLLLGTAGIGLLRKKLKA